MLQQIHTISSGAAGLFPFIYCLIEIGLHPFCQCLTALGGAIEHLSPSGAGKLREAVLMDTDQYALANFIAKSHAVFQIIPLLLRNGLSTFSMQRYLCGA